MDVRHLILLRELAERGSIAAVAEAGHRTPSAVSQQLRTAQRDLGVRLVEPDGRRLRLTDAGELLAGSAMAVEAALARVRADLDALQDRPRGTVRVTALPSAAEFLLPALCAALRAEPVAVELDDQDVAERTFAELARDADVVIGHSLTSEVPAGAESLACTTLCREPLDVAVPADHPLAGRERLRPGDVVGEPWIRVPEGYPFDTVVHALEQVTGRAAPTAQRVRDNRVVEALVVAGEGIALLPRYTTRDRPGMVLRPLTGVSASRWVVAMSRPDRAERAVVRRVVDELVEIGRAVERG